MEINSSRAIRGKTLGFQGRGHKPDRSRDMGSANTHTTSFRPPPICLFCYTQPKAVDLRRITAVSVTKARLGVRQTVSSRNRLSSLNILACSSRSAQPPSRLPTNLRLRRFWLGPTCLASLSFGRTRHSRCLQQDQSF